MHLLTQNVEIREVGAPVTAGSSIDNNSDRIDMSEYESVTFLVPIEDSVATGVATATIQGNSADSDTGMAAVDGCVATATCAVNDDLNGTLLVVELRHPMQRYVQLTRTSETANIAYGTVVALLVPRLKPVTNHSTVSGIAAVSN